MILYITSISFPFFKAEKISDNPKPKKWEGNLVLDI